MKKINQEILGGERALYRLQDAALNNVVFNEGESCLKHSKNLSIENTIFGWKYPLWNSEHILVRHSTWLEMARAGVWYSSDLEIQDCSIQAPKNFRRCFNVSISNTTFSDAKETLWNCSRVTLDHVSAAQGDYFGMNCSDLEINALTLYGNYSFDGAKRMHIKNSTLISKDAFWNCEDILIENCTVIGEYIGWQSKNLTFRNCRILSEQGFCYIDNLVLENCTLLDTDLAFEYSSVKARLNGKLESLKNPLQGIIQADQIGEVIIDPDIVDPDKIRIVQRDE